jgi:hypothetical protein
VPAKQEAADSLLEQENRASSQSKCVLSITRQLAHDYLFLELLTQPDIIELSDSHKEYFVNISHEGAYFIYSDRIIFTLLVEIKGTMKRKGKGKAGGAQKRRKVITRIRHCCHSMIGSYVQLFIL